MAESDLDRLDDTVTHFPLVIPRDTIDVEDEKHQFRSGSDIYRLDKAPVDDIERIRGRLNGEPHTFVRNQDYLLVDEDGDGEDDSVDWSVGGDNPDIGTDFDISYRSKSVISRYLLAHDTDIDGLEDDIDDVIASVQVDRATGEDLTRIGDIFGPLGRRAGRGDQQYRALLKSIVESFRGRGTIPGIKFAISAGTGIDVDNITITEDTDEVGYEIQLDSGVGTSFISGVINDMAEIADPSGVDLLSPPIVLLDGGEIIFIYSSSDVVGSSTGLGGGTLALDGSEQLGGKPPAIEYEAQPRLGREQFGQTRYGEKVDVRDWVTPDTVTDTIQTGDVEHADDLTVDGDFVIRGDMFTRTIDGSGTISGDGTLGVIQ